MNSFQLKGPLEGIRVFGLGFIFGKTAPNQIKEGWVNHLFTPFKSGKALFSRLRKDEVTIFVFRSTEHFLNGDGLSIAICGNKIYLMGLPPAFFVNGIQQFVERVAPIGSLVPPPSVEQSFIHGADFSPMDTESARSKFFAIKGSF